MEGIEEWKGIFLIKGDTHFTKWIKEHGSLIHDTASTNALENYVKNGDTVLDIGSHIGTMAMWFSNKAGYEGKVLCFEPNPRAFYCLRGNIGGLKNTFLHKVGVADKQGEMTLAENLGNYGASHLREGRGIPVITIDSLELQKVDFIKIDCEGMDYRVLLGAQETIKRCRPYICVEIVESHLKRNSNSFADIKAFFNTFGYGIRNLHAGHPIMGEQFDIIAIPNEKRDKEPTESHYKLS